MSCMWLVVVHIIYLNLPSTLTITWHGADPIVLDTAEGSRGNRPPRGPGGRAAGTASNGPPPPWGPGGRCGDRLELRHIRILYKAPKDYTKPWEVPVPSSTLGTWQWSPTLKMLSSINKIRINTEIQKSRRKQNIVVL